MNKRTNELAKKQLGPTHKEKVSTNDLLDIVTNKDSIKIAYRVDIFFTQETNQKSSSLARSLHTIIMYEIGYRSFPESILRGAWFTFVVF